MNITQHLIVKSICIAAFLACGCDFHPKPTYRSPRRILALDVRPPTPPPVIVKYLLDTNNATVMGGTLGSFRGIISVATVSSNAGGWQLQVSFDGSNTAGAEVHTTNLMDIPYPSSRQFVSPGVGTVTGWFLSDDELVEFDKRMTQ